MLKLNSILSRCADWLFPQPCYLCAKKPPCQQLLCADCYQNLPWNLRACGQCGLPLETGDRCGSCLAKPPAFIHCITPFRYEAPISTLIVQLKFHQRLIHTRLLSQLLAEAIRQGRRPLPECIIPVPLHSQRIRQRGFNQALEIARPLSKTFNIPLLFDSCYRRTNTLPQSRLSASARRRNIAAAFDLQQNIPFNHVAIVDDVMTTGQTVRVLSGMLQQQGIKTIEVWCCARAL